MNEPITPGRYRMRNGGIAVVTRIVENAERMCPVEGMRENNVHSFLTWTPHGHYLLHNSRDSRDLIERIEEPKVNDTKFKPGDYKTRDGQSAVVVAVHPHASSTYPLIGYVESSDQWLSWNPQGAAIGENMPSQYDLMPPMRTLWINIYSTPLALAFTNEHEARAAANSARSFIKTITTEIPA